MRDLLQGIWRGMIRRCFDPRTPSFAYYGARGITVCGRWIDSFTAFRDDMGPRLSRKHSVGRIDNDGDYEPGNCRWETAKQQSLNCRPGGTVQRDGKMLVGVDTGPVTFCSEPRCTSRIYRYVPSVPKEAMERYAAAWRFHDDGREPALRESTALCPRHSSPVPIDMTPKGAAALEAEARCPVTAGARPPLMPESIARRSRERYLRWLALQDARQRRSS